MKRIFMAAVFALASAPSFGEGEQQSEWYSPDTPGDGWQQNAGIIWYKNGEKDPIDVRITDGKLIYDDQRQDYKDWYNYLRNNDPDVAIVLDNAILALENALAARNEVSSLAQNILANFVYDIEAGSGQIKWYKGTTSVDPNTGKTVVQKSTTPGSMSIPSYTVKTDESTYFGLYAATNDRTVVGEKWDGCEYRVGFKTKSENKLLVLKYKYPSGGKDDWVEDAVSWPADGSGGGSSIAIDGASLASNDQNRVEISGFASEDTVNIGGIENIFDGEALIVRTAEKDGVLYYNAKEFYNEPWVTNEIVSATNLIVGITNLIVGITNDIEHLQWTTNTVWATNWTEAVKNVTVEETKNIVNYVTNAVMHYDFVSNVWTHEEFVTNWLNHETFTTNVWNFSNFITNIFNHENFVTNLIEKYSAISNFDNFVTYQTNVFNNATFVTNFIEQSVGFTNWHDVYHVTTNEIRIVTNFIYGTQRILGMPEIVDPTSPDYDPKDDPYSPEYEPESEEDNAWKDSIFYKYHAFTNFMDRITNEFTSTVNLDATLDRVSVWTNGTKQIEIAGFESAPSNTVPRKTANGDIEWVSVDTNDLTKIYNMLTNDIDVVKNVLSNFNDNSVFNITVTNKEKFATLSTNLFGVVKADTLLDNLSVWTNEEKKIEIKGYGKLSGTAIPFGNFMDDISWIPLDSDAAVPEQVDVGYKSIDVFNTQFGGDQVGLYGFDAAAVGTVPFVRFETSPTTGVMYHKLSWETPSSGGGGGATRYFGTDSSEAVSGSGSVTNDVYFAPASDSNVKVSVSRAGSGAVTITIGVYYQ